MKETATAKLSVSTLSVRKPVHHRVPVTIHGLLEWQSRPDEEEADDRQFFVDQEGRPPGVDGHGDGGPLAAVAGWGPQPPA